MRTVHPVLKRGGLYWDRDLLPPSGYDARFHRIQAEVAKSGDDAWLVYGDVERYGTLAYFSNFLPRTRSAVALVPREGAPTLLISVGARDVPAAKTLTWIDDVRPFTKLPRTLVGLIEERSLQRARIGLVSVDELLPIKEWSEIVKALPDLKTVSRTADMNALRASKDAHEIEAIRRAARIVAESLDVCARALAPGKLMREALSQAERHIRANAAEDVRLMAASGEQTGLSMRPLDSRILKAGDSIMVYVAAEVQRYWAEAARTFVLGAASDAQRALATQADAALAAMRNAASKGAPVKSLADAAEKALADPALLASARSYGFGNGVGLDLDETPYVTSESTLTIADNSTLALRIIGHANGLGIAAGETILVRSGQTERLIASPSLVECR